MLVLQSRVWELGTINHRKTKNAKTSESFQLWIRIFNFMVYLRNSARGHLHPETIILATTKRKMQFFNLCVLFGVVSLAVGEKKSNSTSNTLKH